ncbi:MAG TPA: hypothetical protein VHN11_15595 [Xanthobacteraceae bacterium]|nr:hypothetical protein [Xanthobacteraceae bacterium]
MRLAEALEMMNTARGFVTEGEEHLRHQRKVVLRLERRGRDARRARELLGHIENMLEKYLNHEERVSNQVILIVMGYAGSA